MRTSLVTLAVAAVAVATFSPDAAPINTGPAKWEGSVIVVDNLLYDAAMAWKVPGVTIVKDRLSNGDDGIRFIYTEPTKDYAGGQAIKALDDRGFITGCTVSVSDDVVTAKPGVLEAVFIHEVGHCLGVSHNYNRFVDSLMAPVLNNNVLELTPEDRKAIERLY